MNSRATLVVALVFLALAAGLLYAGVHWYRATDVLVREGLLAEATVVAVRREPRFTDLGAPVVGQSHRSLPREKQLPSYEVDIPTLRFTARDGRSVELDGAVQTPGSLPIGSVLSVRYLPHAPEGARASADLAQPLEAYVLWALGGALLLPAVLLLVQLARRRA